jgi:hypothetical protein
LLWFVTRVAGALHFPSCRCCNTDNCNADTNTNMQLTTTLENQDGDIMYGSSSSSMAAPWSFATVLLGALAALAGWGAVLA